MNAKEELLEEMQDTSELCVFAQWLVGLEFILWDAIETKNPTFPGGMGTEIDIQRLSELSAQCGGWWIWDEESGTEKFVTLAEWRFIFDHRSKAWRRCNHGVQGYQRNHMGNNLGMEGGIKGGAAQLRAPFP